VLPVNRPARNTTIARPIGPVAIWSIVTAILAALGPLVRASGPDDARQENELIPNVSLVTQDGKDVRFYEDLVKGKIVAINLIYTTCEYACPLETAKLTQVQRLLGDRMGRDIFFYSITIDPEHDTPAVLKEYADKYRAGPGWLFLTGRRADIERLAKRLGLFSERDRATDDGHVPFLLVGNEATGQWMRNSAMDNPGFMARTIGDWLNSWQTAPKEPLKSYAEVPRLAFDRGQYTFATRCAACHTIGRGNHIGPDLHGVTATRDRAWLSRFIIEPDRVRAEGDPTALSLRERYKQVRMPNLNLNEEDAAAIIGYLEERSRAVGPLTSRPVQTASEAPANTTAVRVDGVVDPYLRIQEALRQDSVEGIAAHARTISVAAAKLGPGAERVRAAVALFGAADLPSARAAFAELGDAIISLARDLGASLGVHVKKAYCPMAGKYWLQEGEKIQNPFYGRSMLECGRIVS
jgi:protein SCO1/2